ncbi:MULTISPECIES: DUF7793 family protein [Hwangdonia]|uniref:DUF7793 domain-containing protein n=1 Tax=Hwangdonia seohaensis TaxID=1240727 RepID=A0ABW3R7M6_9FLAO|nr:hypothetical protein [Hwangdonia seohaensis]
MSNQIECNKAKFWLEEGILFCKFIKGNCTKEFSEDFLEEYINAINTLSGGSYLPLLIDLRDLKEKEAFSVTTIIANNTKLKSALLSKSFVVNSYYVQFILVVLRRIHDPIIPNKIFRNYERAIAYSLETNQTFNACS